MTGFKWVYLDTAPIIYYLENSALYRDKIKQFFELCLEQKIQLVTSAITIGGVPCLSICKRKNGICG